MYTRMENNIHANISLETNYCKVKTIVKLILMVERIRINMKESILTSLFRYTSVLLKYIPIVYVLDLFIN